MQSMQNYEWYYVLAAKGLQNYILQGDKLQLMVGASNLIESLPNDLLPDVLTAMGLQENRDFRFLSQSAGGARILFRQEKHATTLASIAPLLIHRHAPGLEFVQDVQKIQGNLPGTMEISEKRMLYRRNLRYPMYPTPGPLVERAPRSGLAAVGVARYGSQKELVDEASRAKKEFADNSLDRLMEKIFSLPESQNGESAKTTFRATTDMGKLAPEKAQYLAILHADANGLGSLVLDVFQELKSLEDADAAEKYASFTHAVELATRRAAYEALSRLVPNDGELEDSQKHIDLPFRPLVLAGDDFTAILRAEDAIRVARVFLDSFERHAQAELGKTGLKCTQNRDITASAGIAFIHKNFPFSQGYQLCEALCEYAKNKTKRSCSSLAFWRVTNSVLDDLDQMIRRELHTHDGTVLTMMPYAVKNDVPGIPSLQSLENLLLALKAMPRGSMRGLLGELYQSKQRAQQALQRILDVANQSKARNGQLDAGIHGLLKALQEITLNVAKNEQLWTKDGRTPLHDAIELLSLNINI